jgi:hypothetical protein
VRSVCADVFESQRAVSKPSAFYREEPTPQEQEQAVAEERGVAAYVKIYRRSISVNAGTLRVAAEDGGRL